MLDQPSNLCQSFDDRDALDARLFKGLASAHDRVADELDAIHHPSFSRRQVLFQFPVVFQLSQR